MPTTSASLLDRLTRGADHAAWERFVDYYTPLMLAWCRRCEAADADAADLMQTVFLILFEQLPQFRYDPQKSFRAWLKTILLNVWRNRQRTVARGAVSLAKPDEIAEDDSFQLLEEREYREHLVRRALTLMQRDFEPATWKACWETVVAERPAADVAAELGISVNSVYLAKSRVLRHLRHELRGFLE